VLRLDGFAHKARAGALRVGVNSDELSTAYAELAYTAQRSGIAPLVRLAPLVDIDRELLVAFWRDRDVGGGMVIGSGGAGVEETRDVTTARLPVGVDDVLRALSRTQAGRSLLGEDHQLALRFADVVLSLRQVFDELPGLSELECNPVGTGPDGVWVVDALPTPSCSAA
jgi:succinyl-CoA synthetase beta subunit